MAAAAMAEMTLHMITAAAAAAVVSSSSNSSSQPRHAVSQGWAAMHVNGGDGRGTPFLKVSGRLLGFPQQSPAHL
jgi:hypothetical protein